MLYLPFWWQNFDLADWVYLLSSPSAAGVLGTCVSFPAAQVLLVQQGGVELISTEHTVFRACVAAVASMPNAIAVFAINLLVQFLSGVLC